MALIDRNHNIEQAPELSFIHNGELPAGSNIETELEEAMFSLGYDGTLQYWQPDGEVGEANGYNREYFVDKINAAASIVSQKRDDVAQKDVDDTISFAHEIFDVYEGKRDLSRQSGSFAFTAATRLQRTDPGEFQAVDYRKETVGCFPIFKYLDNSSAQRVMVGMPPFIIDYYGEDAKGGGGMMVFSPLFLDLIGDANGDLGKAMTWASNVAQETAWLAKERADVKLLSLAALLPKHTDYGKLFEYPGIDTTTGHGGTTWLIGETVQRAIDEGRVDPEYQSKVGVLGVGGIGRAAADLILSSNPDVQVAINDYNTDRQQLVSEELRSFYGDKRVVDAPDAEAVLRFGGVTVSAITRPIDLSKTGLKEGDLEGRVYADDSQPAAIAAEQVESLGGLHTGVIAQDNTDFGSVTMTRFNYGGMGPLEMSQAYGCCVEGAALHYGDAPDEVLIKSEVTGDMVRTVADYCRDLKFSAAALQTLKDGKAVYV